MRKIMFFVMKEFKWDLKKEFHNTKKCLFYCVLKIKNIKYDKNINLNINIDFHSTSRMEKLKVI